MRRYAMSKADDFMELLNPDNFDRTDILHTPTMEAKLGNGELTLTVPYGKFLLNAENTQMLTRFLSERVKVDPLPPAGDFPEDYQAKRVI
jgi:hypothetical protein